MKVGVLGTGMVGRALATKLVAVGHEVVMGSRQAGNPKSAAWAAGMGPSGSSGTFADAAGSAELVVNATGGGVSLQALEMAGADNLAGKVLVDVANPLQRTPGVGLTLSVCNTDSLGEQIQRRFPEARVVKTLNTVNADVMVEPGIVPGSHTMFLCGNDAAAKHQVRQVLESFGWPPADLLDLGDIGAARAMEMYLPLWLRLSSATGSWRLNVKVTVGE
ncbi:MAG: 8-hydroxy-5-deazaflavin:NADPH oxidoreductase [Actinomycetota bacterium]|nr:8-hydroxy-5-deazaflavin:NADPH oxidoreductase [Actinomycetota bacterium]